MKKIIRTLVEIAEAFSYRALFYTKSTKVLNIRFLSKRIVLLPNGYYSQSSQDELVENIILNNQNISNDNISIIDIGSNHPIVLNNTYYFEKNFRAKVFSIEPNPSFVLEYKKNDRDIINCAVGTAKGEMSLFVPKRPLDRIYSDNVHATLLQDELPPESNINLDIIKVMVEPLHNLVPPGMFDVLFIDVEGFEVDVLNGIDFNLFQFNIICIENNSKKRSRSVLRKMLVDKGYRLHARIHGLDDIFIRIS